MILPDVNVLVHAHREDAGARGNLIPDAFLAAMAIEHRCEWIITDRGFARFEG